MAHPNTAPQRSIEFGLIITAIGGLLFTLDLPLLRLAAADKWTMVFARGVMLFMSITAVWLFMRWRTNSKTPYIAGTAGVAVIFTNTLANITYMGAIAETNAANVVFILALIPVLTAIFSRIFIGEPVHHYTWLASILAFVGVGIIAWDGVHSGTYYGDFLAFICACCTAAAFTIIRWSGKNIANSLAVGSLISAAIALAFFPIDFATLANTATFNVPSWVWIALNGMVAIPLASSLISNGPRYLPSTDVSMFFLLETVLTPVWIWMIFGEQPSRAVLFGGVIVITTLIIHSLWRLNRGLAFTPAR
jgi:drug/metabolite transporter (DMT)-like permease